MSGIILKVKELMKSYNKGKTYASNNINFTVKAGEIVGLVGENGAGKSTIIKSITGIIPFDSGEISINGYDVTYEPIGSKSCLGYVPDVCNAFDKMTGMEYLNFVADIFKVSKENRASRVEEFQKYFPLGDSINKSISSYSHGMKQKISIMASLIAKPKLWILDEPITGLDTQTTLNVLNYMKEYANQGNAVLFSSHNLDIVQKICDRAIIIKGGNLIADVNIDELEQTSNFELEKYFMEKIK